MPPQLQVNKAADFRRVSMCIWGPPGCGKTWLAGTAPGKRLWINFDPDGTSSLPYSEDTLIVDYSNEPANYVEQVKSFNPFDLEAHFKAHPDISTVVIDSVTKFAQASVQHSIGKAPGATFENPGRAGYGYRSRFTLNLISSVLVCTGKHNKHVIFIAHEGTPQTSDEGVIQAITLLLGGTLPVDVPMQLSEVWHMRDLGKERRVSVRQAGLIKPMKTRMFDTTDGYDFATSTQLVPNKITLAALFQQWQENKYEKLKLPK